MSNIYGTLPAGVAWIPGNARQGVRCHFCMAWIFRGDKLERGLGETGYVAHKHCLESAQADVTK